MEYDPVRLIMATLVIVAFSAAVAARIKWMKRRDEIEQEIRQRQSRKA